MMFVDHLQLRTVHNFSISTPVIHLQYKVFQTPLEFSLSNYTTPSTFKPKYCMRVITETLNLLRQNPVELAPQLVDLQTM